MSSTEVRTIDSLIRVSRENGRKLDRDDGGNTIRTQRERNRLSIERNGGRVGREYVAVDESGSTVFRTPEWLEALDRVGRGESAGVAFEYIDRFGRNTPEGLAYAAEITARKGAVIVDGRPINFEDPYEKAMFGNALVQAEMTVDIAKVRARRTMNDVKKRGIANRQNYGYIRNTNANGDRIDPKRDRKAFLIDDTKAPTIELIFKMRAAGHHWTAIIDELHRLGVPSPSGQPYWISSSLSAIVKHRVYLGEVKMGDTVTKRAHPPIVSAQLWKAAQSKAVRVRTGKNVPGVAHGLLTCSGCGNPLQVQGSGDGRTFYGCRRRSGAGPCPAPVNGDQHKLDEFVDDIVAEQLDGGGLDAVQARRDISAAHKALAAALEDRDNFVRGTKGSTAPVISEVLAERDADVERAQAVYDEAKAAAEAASDLPISGDAYRQRPVAARKRYAAQLITELVLEQFPPGAGKRGANPADRIRRPIPWA